MAGGFSVVIVASLGLSAQLDLLIRASHSPYGLAYYFRIWLANLKREVVDLHNVNPTLDYRDIRM